MECHNYFNLPFSHGWGCWTSLQTCIDHFSLLTFWAWTVLNIHIVRSGYSLLLFPSHLGQSLPLPFPTQLLLYFHYFSLGVWWRTVTVCLWTWVWGYRDRRAHQRVQPDTMSSFSHNLSLTIIYHWVVMPPWTHSPFTADCWVGLVCIDEMPAGTAILNSWWSWPWHALKTTFSVLSLSSRSCLLSALPSAVLLNALRGLF